MVSVPTKWKLAAALFCLTLGGLCFAAFLAVARQRLEHPNGQTVGLNDITWVAETGSLLLFCGQTILFYELLTVAIRGFKRWRRRA